MHRIHFDTWASNGLRRTHNLWCLTDTKISFTAPWIQKLNVTVLHAVIQNSVPPFHFDDDTLQIMARSLSKRGSGHVHLFC